MVARLAPTIWRTCRILANASRLQLLAAIPDNGRATVSELARRCHVPPNVASENLRLIQSRGLLRASREGRWVYYSVGADESVRHA